MNMVVELQEDVIAMFESLDNYFQKKRCNIPIPSTPRPAGGHVESILGLVLQQTLL